MAVAGFVSQGYFPGGHGRVRASSPRASAWRMMTAGPDSRLRGKTVLVTGATGGTGRLICGKLEQYEANVVALVRPTTFNNDKDRVKALMTLAPKSEIILGDLRENNTIESMVRDADAVVWSAGTRSFSNDDPNRPSVVDNECVFAATERFLEAQLVHDLRDALLDNPVDDEHSRFVLISSLGVTRPDSFPLISAMGDMLRNKHQGEEALRASGVPYTIIRPGRMVDDATGGIEVDQGDRMEGAVQREVVADLAVQSLFRASATNVTFECVNNPKIAYPKTRDDWAQIFAPLVEDNVEVAVA